MQDENLKNWSTKYGTEYTKRNSPNPIKRGAIFKKLLEDTEIKGSVLEVGCNKGHNIDAIRMVSRFHTFWGLEPNIEAIKEQSHWNFNIIKGNIYDIPWRDENFDLVFTAGVLIHLPDDRLIEGMKELHRVSRRYIMSIEYFDKEQREIEYRDNVFLAARPFDKIWTDNFDLKLIKEGEMKSFGISDDTDFSQRSNYVIYEKI